jgi:hypothetical protein
MITKSMDGILRKAKPQIQKAVKMGIGAMLTLALVFSAVILSVPKGNTLADSNNITFESPTYTLGDINGQNGWTKTGAYDVAVDDSLGTSGFGDQSLRISNAVTSGSFGDQTFAPALSQAAGETGADNGSFGAATPVSHFESSFDIFAIADSTGDTLSVSPDRGDGARMSYLRFENPGDDLIHVYFDDVTDPAHTINADSFNETEIAQLDSSVPHNIKFSMDFIDGPDNDVVNITIDGTSVHTGTSWEDYYRFDSESNPSNNTDYTPTVRTVLFRASGTAVPANEGKGYLIDNFTDQSSGEPASSTVVVSPSDMHGWYFYDDQADAVLSDTSDHGFVTGPATPPIGTGSVHLTKTTTDKYGIATTQFQGTALNEINTLQYSTYRASGTSAQVPSLGFDIDSDTTDGDTSYQGRLTYEPYFTHTVDTGVWQTWNTQDNAGTGNWWFSHATLSGGAASVCVQANPCTWSELTGAYPNAAMLSSGQFILRTNGADGEVFDGNVDNLIIGIANNTTTFDFDPESVSQDDMPPAVTGPTFDMNPIIAGQDVTVSATADDTGQGDSNIASIEYNIDGGTWTAMDPTDGAFDSVTEDGQATVNFDAGDHTVCVRASDVAGNTSLDDANCANITVESATPPPTKDQCMNGAWKTMVDSDGNHFKNQGDCVSFVATQGKNKGSGN